MRDRRFFLDEAAEGRAWPGRIEDLWEPIAVAFHWPPQAMNDMSLDEIWDWSGRAVAILKAKAGKPRAGKT
ncbi:GpE family phage tail protein [Brevundimonas nasdae]|uniref:GpE family phage tail protein n=1 Tax=Brevundimonas nasdae TaxID=172043 RepID=UPI003F68C980